MERKQKIVENIIKRISDAKYNVVPEILLEGKALLSSSDDSEIAAVKGMLWNTGYLKYLSEAMERDYLKVKNDWIAASKISDLLVECCQDNKIAASSTEFEKQFLVITCKRMWQLLFNIHQIYLKNKGLKRLEIAYRNVSVNIYVFCKNNKQLSKFGFELPITMRMLQSEVTILDLTLLELCLRITKVNKNFVSELNEEIKSRTFTCFVKKFLSSKDPKLASLCLSTILLWLENSPTLMKLINDKQDDVLDTLDKWKGRNFDSDVTKLQRYIETSSLIHAEEETTHRASIVIQSFWRSYTTRKRLAKMKAGFFELQQLFKQKKARREQLIKEQGVELERKFETKMKNIGKHKKFLDKQYHAVASIHPSLVDKYLEEKADWAARKIQSAWKGYKTRKHLAFLRQEAMIHNAAKVIQKSMIKYTDRQKRLKYHLREWPGLTEERREQLQRKIDRWNDDHKMLHQPDRQTLEKVHKECQEKLVALYANRLSELNAYQKREALMARLQIDSSLLESIESDPER